MSDSLPQKRPGAAALGAAFSEKTRKQRETAAQDGTAMLLSHLSLAIRELQEAGVDVSLDMRTGTYSQAYDMLYSTALAQKTGHIAAYGFLHTGPMTQLVALVTQADKAPAASLIVSGHDTAEGSSRIAWTSSEKTPAKVYNFMTSDSALADFQQDVIERAAEYKAMMECDAEGVFNRPAPLAGRMLAKPAFRPRSAT